MENTGSSKTVRPYTVFISGGTNFESVAWICETKINIDDMDWSVWKKQMNAEHILVAPFTDLTKANVTICREPKTQFQ